MQYDLEEIVYYFQCLDGHSTHEICEKVTLGEAITLFKLCLDNDVKKEKFCDITTLNGRAYITNKRSDSEIKTFFRLAQSTEYIDNIIKSYYGSLMATDSVSINFEEKQTYAIIKKVKDNRYRVDTFSDLYSEIPIETFYVTKDELYDIFKTFLSI